MEGRELHRGCHSQIQAQLSSCLSLPRIRDRPGIDLVSGEGQGHHNSLIIHTLVARAQTKDHNAEFDYNSSLQLERAVW